MSVLQIPLLLQGSVSVVPERKCKRERKCEKEDGVRGVRVWDGVRGSGYGES